VCQNRTTGEKVDFVFSRMVFINSSENQQSFWKRSMSLFNAYRYTNADKQRFSFLLVLLKATIRALVLALAAVLRSRLVNADVSTCQHTSAYVRIRCQRKSRTLVPGSCCIFLLTSHFFAKLSLCDWHMLHFITLRAKSPEREKAFE
jgi:hypothetical protein